MDGRVFGLVTCKTLVILDRSRKKKESPDEERRLLSRRSEGESRDDRRLFLRISKGVGSFEFVLIIGSKKIICFIDFGFSRTI
ncbi:hypothetical protein YC2023_045508 [Brassica napus]